MFKPPPLYFWQKQVKAYETNFRRKVPQWVLTLDVLEATRLLSVANRIGLKLHPDVLTKGESRIGKSSPWSDLRNSWDGTSIPKAKPKFET